MPFSSVAGLFCACGCEGVVGLEGVGGGGEAKREEIAGLVYKYCDMQEMPPSRNAALPKHRIWLERHF